MLSLLCVNCVYFGACNFPLSGICEWGLVITNDGFQDLGDIRARVSCQAGKAIQDNPDGYRGPLESCDGHVAAGPVDVNGSLGLGRLSAIHANANTLWLM